MILTNTRFDIDLDVETTPLPYFNIGLETSLTNEYIFDLEDLDEDNFDEETKESNNNSNTIIILGKC